MAIDYGSPVGQVRLLIPDLIEAEPIFTDEQIEVFLTLSSDSVSLATAQALRVIASSDLMLFKVAVRSDDGSIGNASNTAKLLLKRAEDLEFGKADIGFDLVGGETYVPRSWNWYAQCL